MRRVVISTVGTSLLTNQINRGNPSEKDWYDRLRDTANLKWDDLKDEIKQIIAALKDTANKKLEDGKISDIRRASAELNGIYGIYKEDMTKGKEDIHYLIATDTAQGTMTAEIVKIFLQKKGLTNTNIYTPPGLSTVSTSAFSEGIDELIVWLRQEIPPLQKNYKICFNLVGGFKSLQGYLNTIGMFYADEIIYIFEGKDSDLITIPRLPIAVDRALIEPHTVNLALMDAGAGLSPSQTEAIPEALIGEVDNQKILSTWGKLIWEQCKDDLLSNNLLEFPSIQYKDSFRADYNRIRDKQEKVSLQESLAKVSHLLSQSGGNISSLKKDAGLLYSRYQGSDKIDHFRVDLSQRVSCEAVDSELVLRYYGTHDYVQGKEKL